MSIFPVVDETEEDSSGNPAQKGFKEPLFDFETKRIVIKDGKVIMGNKKEKIEQWIRLLIMTQVEKYGVYKGTWFGLTDLYNLRGHQFLTSTYGISEIKRELKEKIEKHEDIDLVKNIKVNNNFDVLKIEITVVVADEEIISEVII